MIIMDKTNIFTGKNYQKIDPKKLEDLTERSLFYLAIS